MAIKLTDALLGEHGVFYKLFDRMLERAAATTRVEDIKADSATLGDVLISHAKIENEILFPALQAKLGAGGLLDAMRDEHGEIEMFFEGIAESHDVEDARARLEQVIEVTRLHFEKEEEALFPTTRDTLSDSELYSLGAQWADVRRVRVG